MIKKSTDQHSEIRKDMRGGEGEIAIKHHLKREEMNAKCRLCSELTLKPGCSIGSHDHTNEDEIYIIQKGKALINDAGKDIEVDEGDVIITGNGASHSIKNIGDKDLIVTAIIMQY